MCLYVGVRVTSCVMLRARAAVRLGQVAGGARLSWRDTTEDTEVSVHA